MGGYGHDNRPSDAGFGPVRATGLVDEIVEQLEKAILEGRLRPGDRVVEAALARTMGVSRAPVREAARILAERGLLNQLPRRGFFVRGMTLKEIDDIFDMIAALTHHALHDGGSGDMTKADEISLYVNQIGSGLAPSDGDVQIETELHLLRLVSLLSNNNRLCETFDLMATELKIAARLNPAQPLSKKMLGEYGTYPAQSKQETCHGLKRYLRAFSLICICVSAFPSPAVNKSFRQHVS